MSFIKKHFYQVLTYIFFFILVFIFSHLILPANLKSLLLPIYLAFIFFFSLTSLNRFLIPAIPALILIESLKLFLGREQLGEHFIIEWLILAVFGIASYLISKIMLFGKLNATAEETGNNVSSLSNSESENKDTIKNILSLCEKTLSPHSCFICEKDNSDNDFIIKNLLSKSQAQIEKTFPKDEGIFAGLLKSLKPIIMRDISYSYNGLTYYIDTPDIQTFIGIPIVSGTKFYGILCLDSKDKKFLSKKKEELIHQYAKIIKRIYQEKEDKIFYKNLKDELSCLYESSISLSSNLNLGNINLELSHAASRIVDSDLLAIIFHEKFDNLCKINFINDEKYSSLLGKTFNLNPENGLASWVIKHSNSYYSARDKGINDKRVLFDKDIGCDDFKSVFIVPLKSHSKTIGCVVLASIESDKFQNHERRLIEVITNQAAILIENARMYLDMEKMATIDGLTSAYNHRYFQERLEEMILKAKRYPEKISLIMCDIDNFKSINDKYGHPVGDKVLQKTSQTINKSIRKIDFSARYGGEEFAIILPSTDASNALFISERIKNEIAKTPLHMNGSNLSVTISLGIA